MRILTTLLFFIHLKIMYAVADSYTDGTKTLIYPNITPEKASELLAEIKSNEILPLILFITNPENTDFDHPEDLEVVATKAGRMVTGTQFSPNDAGNQLFLCPKLIPDDICFVPTQFEASQMLKCPVKAIPILKETNDIHPCGSGNVGTTYTVSYDVCLEKNYQVRKDVIFYAVCFDKNKRKTLYTDHTIMSPKLVYSNLLLREHQIKFPMMTNGRIIPSNYQTLDDYFNGIGGGLPYKVKLLVPPEDMPFALWSKTTYQYVNAELQHEKLVPLWDKINEYVRSYALKLYISSKGNTSLRIHTTVVEVSSGSRERNQKSNMWVKLVFTEGASQQQAIAILMNNFIDTNRNESKSSENNLKNYCWTDLCMSDLKKDFKIVKGNIRCCSLTPKVAQLFGIQVRDNYVSILKIPSLNHA